MTPAPPGAGFVNGVQLAAKQMAEQTATKKNRDSLLSNFRMSTLPPIVQASA
jgi:hypothetical protein